MLRLPRKSQRHRGGDPGGPGAGMDWVLGRGWGENGWILCFGVPTLADDHQNMDRVAPLKHNIDPGNHCFWRKTIFEGAAQGPR